jgi:hypothetical protein
VAGQTDVTVLLADLAAELRPGEYVFAHTAGDRAGLDDGVLASVIEPEGLSVVVTREQADRAGWPYDFVAAWITLRVHSALDAVGLTAAVSSALAGAGLSCNVIAGYYHDHLLVPVDRAQQALRILHELSVTARSGRPR